MGFNGFKIVLTGDESLVSTYHRTYLGFAAGLPIDVLHPSIGSLLFPTESGEHGRMKTTQYGLAKIEAALLENGFSRDEVAIVDPRRLDEAIGPETRVVGISLSEDPLGINHGTAFLRVVLMLMGIEARLPSFSSYAAMRLLTHPAIRRSRSKIKVIAGGQGAWEIIDSGLQRKLGIDTIVEGEGELAAIELFRKAVNNEPLPSYFRGPPVPVEMIPIIRTPSRGHVEITRGCGRGCRFCNPTLLMFRSIPLDKIVREAMVNVAGGEDKISLHSEDFLRYGSTGLNPNRDKVLRLLNTVTKIPGVRKVSLDFVTPSTAMIDPKLVRESAEIIGLSERNRSIIEIGIESASPRILNQIAPGKPLPFSAEEWPKVVEDAIVTLNDAGWWVTATMIVGLPGERPEDIRANIRLAERLEPYDVFIFPVPFIPSGGLRRAKGLSLKEILPKSQEALELIAIAVYDAIKKIRRLSFFLVSEAHPVIRPLLGGLLYFASTIGLRRLQWGISNLSKIPAIELVKQQHVEIRRSMRI